MMMMTLRRWSWSTLYDDHRQQAEYLKCQNRAVKKDSREEANREIRLCSLLHSVFWIYITSLLYGNVGGDYDNNHRGDEDDAAGEMMSTRKRFNHLHAIGQICC